MKIDNFKLFCEKIIDFKYNNIDEDVDNDVDNIYNKYFKHIIDKINNNETIGYIERVKLDTSILKSDICKEAHSLNSCEIIINNGSNFYHPVNKVISISINGNALELLRDKTKEEVLESLDEYYHDLFLKDLSDVRIKGSIHHELIHWIDSTLNYDIEKKLAKLRKIKSKRNLKNVNINDFEINSTIGNIYQSKKIYSKEWDNMTFYDLIKKTPHLNTVYRQLKNKDDERKEWVVKLVKRCVREDLLSKKMLDTVNDIIEF